MLVINFKSLRIFRFYCIIFRLSSKIMSQPRLEPCIPVPLDAKLLNSVVDKAKDWALMHGAGMRDKKAFSPDTLNVAPFVLTPSTFPRAEFYKALEIQPILNELMHNVAHDDVFLKETLANTLEVDDFTASLYKIWETVTKEGISQSLTLGLLRSDYLLQSSEGNVIKQVEINTVASSFAGIATLITRYHSYILRQLGHGDKIKNMPENKALSGLCEGMTDAFDLYGDFNAVILFVVEDVTYNICDQRFHEFQINETRPEIKVIRKTLTEIYNQSVLNAKKELILDDRPVAVVYFRAGYEPSHYHSDNEWKARLMIERSIAIKCPSIHYHLAGTKKVQQALAVEGALERFVKDPALVQRVRDIFTGLYALDLDQRGEDAVKMAIQDSERFVLKPQREGGGNNVYGLAVRDELLRMGATRERAAFVLMERIRPPAVLGHVVRPHGDTIPPLSVLVSELGVFGVVIGSKDKILVNRQVGHMLRTKLADADEGGVAAGLGALDSPYLVD